MPTSELFSPNSSGGRWTLRGSKSKGLGKGLHAEQEVTGFAGEATVLLIEQDAFPCSVCDAHFLNLSTKGRAYVFRVTEDGTGDRNFHIGKGLPVGAGYPCAIYYCAGARSYNAAPVGWPPAPPV